MKFAQTQRSFAHPIALGLALSIAAAPITVNAWAGTLSSFNKDKADSGTRGTRISPRDRRAIARLIALVLRSGQDSVLASKLASAVGPETADELPLRDVLVGDRLCSVPNPARTRTKPTCVYFRIHDRTKTDLKTKYFRVGLDGRLEKAFEMHAVYDSAGKVVGGNFSHPDVESPEVQKDFRAEMDFWLKEWLPKQMASAEKTAKNAGRDAPRHRKSGAKATPEARR